MMDSQCCLLYLAKELAGYIRDRQLLDVSMHWLIYIVQKVFKIHLGYRFKWGVKGPYSRGLARDLRISNLREKCICNEDLRIPAIREFLEDLKATNIRFERALELAASYIMLELDVYPRPTDPLKELLEKRPYFSLKEARTVVKVVNKYLTSLMERA